eukprot:11503705-Alexandrium_andersonii.AAC.1
MYDHTIQKVGVFSNGMVQYLSDSQLNTLAMPISWIKQHEWTCSANGGSCKTRWMGDPDNGVGDR